MVITDRGIVATSQTLASQAGAQVLARGGSAIDAAIAANAVLGVVEPESDGIGGDLFAIYWDAKTGKLTAINASGWAPTGLTIDFLKSQGITSMPQAGIHSVTVPGCVDGWEKLHKRFGKLPWADLFQPAIYYRRPRLPGHRDDQRRLADGGEETRRRPERTAASSCATARRPRLGEMFRDPEMAAAFKLIAAAGRSRVLPRCHRQGHPQDQRPPRRQTALPPTWRSSRRNGWSRSPPNTAAGRSTSCRPTDRASPRSRC